jgi:hypothetical protein
MTHLTKAIQKLEPHRKEKSPFAFCLPTRIGVYGSSGSGKTHRVVQWLCTDKPWGAIHEFDQVIWCSPTNGQAKLQLVKKKWKEYVHFIDGLNEARVEELIQQGEQAHPPYTTLVVLDDLMLQTSQNGHINKLFYQW